MSSTNGTSTWYTDLIRELTEYGRKRTAFERNKAKYKVTHGNIADQIAFERVQSSPCMKIYNEIANAQGVELAESAKEKRERVLRDLAREEAELAQEASRWRSVRDAFLASSTTHTSSLRATSRHASSSSVNRAARRKRRRGSNRVVESSSSDDEDTTDDDFNGAAFVTPTTARMSIPRSSRTTSGKKSFHEVRNDFWKAMLIALEKLHPKFGFRQLNKSTRRLPSFVLTYNENDVTCIEMGSQSSAPTYVDSMPKLYIFLSKYRGLKDEVRREVGPLLFERYLSAGPRYRTKDFYVAQEFDELERMTAAYGATKSRED